MVVSNVFQLSLGFLFMLLSLQGVQSVIRCEQLLLYVCTFSVSSGGNRCVLEKSVTKDEGERNGCGGALGLAILCNKALFCCAGAYHYCPNASDCEVPCKEERGNLMALLMSTERH
eukprot:Gb_39075 [translate_table: standard]